MTGQDFEKLSLKPAGKTKADWVGLVSKIRKNKNLKNKILTFENFIEVFGKNGVKSGQIKNGLRGKVKAAEKAGLLAVVQIRWNGSQAHIRIK